MIKRKQKQDSTENLILLSNENTKSYHTSKETTCLQIELTEYKKGPKITLTWADVSAFCIPQKQQKYCSWLRKKNIESKKQILFNVNGLAKSGELLAIMGASGAGKTTLLNILTNTHRGSLTVSGEVHVNNQPVTKNVIASIAAYVRQDSLFIGTLTVKEQLIFRARLTMGNTTYPEILRRVNQIIYELGLSKSQDTLTGVVGRIKGISSGEKLRLAIACEILTDPPLLFCDEPTSGLDISMARHVVTILHNLAIKGKTVICTIHQPSSEIYATFDKVLFLAEGRVAYLGTRDGALEYFHNLNFKCPATHNPADFFMHTLAVTADDAEKKKSDISEICDLFKNSAENALIKEEIESIIKSQMNQLPAEINKSCYKAPWMEQFKAVCWRSCLSAYNEPLLVQARILQTFLIGLCVGIFYYHQDLTQLSIPNINSAIWILLVNISLQNMYAVIHVFCSDLPIFFLEHSSGFYDTSSYFIGKTLAEQLVFIITPAIFITMSYWLIGLNPNISTFLIACLIYILIANTSTSFGYLVSSIFSSMITASTVAASSVRMLLLFGGIYMSKMSIPWYLDGLSSLSWFSYGFDALLINQWADVNCIECNVNNNTCPKDGLEILQENDINPTKFLPNIFALIALLACFRFAAFAVLRVRAYKSL